VHRLLAAPPTGLQDAADMGWMVRDPEAVSNQGGHSRLGPHIALETQGWGSLGQ
jgi:hypothetical protein